MNTESLERHNNTQHTGNMEELELVDMTHICNEPTQCLDRSDQQDDILDIEVEHYKFIPYLLSTYISRSLQKMIQFWSLTSSLFIQRSGKDMNGSKIR